MIPDMIENNVEESKWEYGMLTLCACHVISRFY